MWSMCAQRTDPWRFGVRMGYKLRRHWRKSSQWFALTRKHAELVMQDTDLLPIFAQHCQNAWDNDLNRCGTLPSSCKAAFPFNMIPCESWAILGPSVIVPPSGRCMRSCMERTVACSSRGHMTVRGALASHSDSVEQVSSCRLLLTQVEGLLFR